MTRLLLGSGGIRTEERLQLWKDTEAAFLGASIDRVLFIPYASPPFDQYVQNIQKMDLHPGREVQGIHTFADPKQAVAEAQAIHIGGGNTFLLLQTLQNLELLPVIREKVISGTPYLGISAGSNMACPTIQTTNDMPIVYPNGFEALNLFPYQINAHYYEGSFYTQTDNEFVQHRGETREQRIAEYHRSNTTPVIGLHEGSILRVEGKKLTTLGNQPARFFQPDKAPENLPLELDLP